MTNHSYFAKARHDSGPRGLERRRIPDRRRTAPAGRPEAHVTLIMPALNEANALRIILPRIPSVVDQVIVVDGGSTDDTDAVVRTLSADAVLLPQGGRGKGDALKSGLAVADGDILVTMDADGSMNPEDIPAFVDALHHGADFVKGSRALPGAGSADFTRLRRAGNSALTTFANILFGAAYTDITFGFNAYWPSTIRHLGRLADGFEFEIQAAIRAVTVGMRTTEVPAHEPARVGGVSKLSPVKDGAAILRIILAEASPRRAAQLGAAYEAAEQHNRGARRSSLLDYLNELSGQATRGADPGDRARTPARTNGSF